MFQDDAVGLPPVERSGPLAWLAPVSLMLLAAAALPLLLPDMPPFGEYPNHLMRLQAIAYLDLDPDLSRFYRVQWGILPNLAMDLLVPPLGTLVGMDAALKAFTVAAFVLMVSGAFALYRAVWGRLDLGPLAAFLFLYTLATAMGLFDALFGMGLALWALAAWVAARGAPARFAVALAAVPLLFFAHLAALGLFALGLLAYEAWRLTATGAWRDARRLIPDLAAFVPPLLIAPALLLQGSAAAEFPGALHWDPDAKLMALDWLFGAYSTPVGIVTAGAIVLGVAWGLWSGALMVHPAGWLLLGLGAAAFAAMPSLPAGSASLDGPFWVGTLLLAVGFARWDLPGAPARSAFVAAVAAVALLRIADAGAAVARVEPAAKELRQALTLVQPGSRILVATADGSERRTPLRLPQHTDDRAVGLGLRHVPALAMAQSSFVATASARPAGRILRINEPYRHLDGSPDGTLPQVDNLVAAHLAPWTQADRPWGHWSERFDIVVVLYTEPPMGNPVPDRLTLTHDGPHARIYRVRR